MTHVLKIGGNELDDPAFLPALARRIARLEVPPIVVHGGGQAIARLQERLGIHPRKVDGIRITDAESLLVAQQVLCGQSNKQIVGALMEVGVDAIGLCGLDGALLRCRKKMHPKVDLGLVGEVVEVRTTLLRQLMEFGLTVVLAPISVGPDGAPCNVNADDAACAVAAALRADRLDFVSNVPGVLRDGAVVPTLTPAETAVLVANGTIEGGMVAKTNAALFAIGNGVREARIADLDGLAGDGGTRFLPARKSA